MKSPVTEGAFLVLVLLTCTTLACRSSRSAYVPPPRDPNDWTYHDVTNLNLLSGEWAKEWTGHPGESRYILDIEYDSSGFVYVVDVFYCGIDCATGGPDGHFAARAESEASLRKFDLTGNLVWSRTWTVDEEYMFCYLEVNNVEVDPEGNVYVCGYLADTVDFDLGPSQRKATSNGKMDAFLCKLDSNGSPLWVRNWGGSYNDGATELELDKHGNAFVGGHFYGEVDFDPGATVAAKIAQGEQYENFICKFDPNGNFEWVDTFIQRSTKPEIECDASGNAYVGLHQLGESTRISGSTRVVSGQTELTAYGPDGNVLWRQTWDPACSAFEIDSNDELYLGGTFSRPVDFDTGPRRVEKKAIGGSNYFGDAYLAKLDSTGQTIWARAWGGEKGEGVTSIAFDDKGRVYVLGCFDGTVDFDPSPGEERHTSGPNVRFAQDTQNVFISAFESEGGWLGTRTLLLDPSWCHLAAGGAGVYTSSRDSLVGLLSGSVSSVVGGVTARESGFLDNADPLASIGSSLGVEFCRVLRGPGENVGLKMAADPSGDLLFAGTFTQSLQFGTPSGTAELRGSASPQTFVGKASPEGEVLWMRTWENRTNIPCESPILSYSGSFITVRDICTDHQGNVLICGQFKNPVDFNPGSGEDIHHPIAGRTSFACKLSPQGDYLWTKTWAGPHHIHNDAYAVGTDGAGNVYVTGQFKGTCDFDPGPGAFELTVTEEPEDPGLFDAPSDVYVVKLSPSGSFRWAINWGRSGFLRYWKHDVVNPHDMVVDENGNTYVASYFAGAVDFDPGRGAAIRETVPNPDGTYALNTFVCKVDNQGSLQWVHSLVGPDYGSSMPHAISLAESGDCCVAGQCNSRLLVDPTPDDLAESEGFGGPSVKWAFLCAFDGAGTHKWFRFYNGFPLAVEAGSEDDVFMLENVWPGSYSTPNYGPYPDGFIDRAASSFAMRFDSSGNLLDLLELRNLDKLDMNDLTAVTSQELYTFGTLTDRASFQSHGVTTDIAPEGESDICLTKILFGAD